MYQEVDIYCTVHTRKPTSLSWQGDSVSLQIASGMYNMCGSQETPEFHYLTFPLRPVLFILPALGTRLGFVSLRCEYNVHEDRMDWDFVWLTYTIAV